MTEAASILLVLAVPLAVGYGLMHLWTGRAALVDELLFKLPMGLAIGVGLTGATTFLGMLVIGRVSIVFELALLAALLVALRRWPPGTWAPTARPRTAPKWLLAGVGASLLVLGGFGAVLWISAVMNEPAGAWDAWDFWNMRARFFVRALDDWPRAYTSVMLWSQPHYPPQLPASVARGFLLVGSESYAVPIALAVVFTVAPVALVASTLRRIRGTTAAALATASLLGAPYFVIHGAHQYADAPLSAFFVATFAFVALYDAEPGEHAARRHWLWLAGLAASLAALTKNEGQLFLIALVVARSVVAWRAGGAARWKQEGFAFALGALPIGSLVAIFKLRFAAMPVTGELYVGRSIWWDYGPVEHVQRQLGDGDRWLGLVESWWRELTEFDWSWPVPLLVALLGYALIAGLSKDRPRATLRMAAIFFAIEVVFLSVMFMAWSTYPIRVHMDALNRLAYQLLPSMVLLTFLALRSPGEPAPEPKRTEPPRLGRGGRLEDRDEARDQ